VDARGFVERLARAEGSEESLAHLEVLEPREPDLGPLPPMPDLLRGRLGLLGIEGLYPHQRRALDLLETGSNVVVATGTASGKTLVYNLAFARAVLENEKRTALYVFPT
jgi:DEAD/DEAH box helicase domain-containing protein